MSSLLYLLLSLLSQKGVSQNHDHSHSHGHWGHDDHRTLIKGVQTCGFQDPDPATLVEDAKSFELWKSTKRTVGTDTTEYTIPVFVHVIAFNENTMVSHGRVWQYINYMNDAFLGTPFDFALQEITDTVNDNWSNNGLTEHIAYKSALKRGDNESLNIYIVNNIPGYDGGTLAGFTFPPSQSTFIGDGVTISRTSPSDRDRLNTLVHEVGHWLGLLHTFAGNTCDEMSPGDLVDDTPQHLQPSLSGFTCNSGRDTCRNLPGPDPVHNFMTYSPRNDACRSTFTPGQSERMLFQYEMFRKPVGAVAAVTMTPTISPLAEEVCSTVFGACATHGDCCFGGCRGPFWIIPKFCFFF